MGATFSRVKEWNSGDILTASDQNTEFDNIISNLTPAGVDDASANASAMQAVTDPYPSAAASLATDLAGEFQRLRYQIKAILGETHWYIDADTSLAALYCTTRGDIIVRGATTTARVAKGTAGQALIGDGTDTKWGVSPGMYGFLDRAQFIHSNDTDILIEPGCYHHKGTVDQMVYWNSQLTFSASNIAGGAADQIVYVYLDDSAIVTLGVPLLNNTCFIDSNTAPTWSDAKHGWYGAGVGGVTATDRCIFACSADAANDLLPWYHDGGRQVTFDTQVESMGVTDVDVAFVEVTMDSPDFGDYTRVLATIKAQFLTTDGGLIYWRKKGSSAAANICGASASYGMANSFSLFVDGDHKIEVAMQNASDSTIAVYTDGFFLPRGM